MIEAARISTRPRPPDPTVAWRTGVSYDRADLEQALDAVLAELGGIEAFVRPGDRVLINPNFLSARPPDRGVTTHPALTMAVADRVRRAGGKVWIGDSPAGARKGVKRVWRRTGHLEAAHARRHELVNFEQIGGEVEQVGGQSFLLNHALLEADVLISLPKLKTHGLTLYTGAIKNVFGNIPGFAKGQFHKDHPHPAAFAEVIATLYGRVRPHLTIMDGIVGMEGNGPASGDRREFGWLMAGRDGVALDTLASWLLGFDPGRIDTTRLAAERGLGTASLSEIPVCGPDPRSLRLTDAKLPSNAWLRRIPEAVLRGAARLLWIRPVVLADKCTGCKACVEGCPTGTIDYVDRKAIIDPSGCINCLCCHEVCTDEAVGLSMSRLARVFA